MAVKAFRKEVLIMVGNYPKEEKCLLVSQTKDSVRSTQNNYPHITNILVVASTG